MYVLTILFGFANIELNKKLAKIIESSTVPDSKDLQYFYISRLNNTMFCIMPSSPKRKKNHY